MNTRHHYLSLLRTFALATLTAAAVTACTDDNGDPAGNEPITPAGGIPVTFTANINLGSDADPAGAPDTRTVLTPTNDNGFTVTWKGRNDNSTSYDKIRIWAAQGTTTIGFKTYVPTTSEASSVLEPEDDTEKLTLTPNGEWKFTAVYGEKTFGNNGTATANLLFQSQSAPDNTDHIAQQDFSVATAQQNILDAGSEMPRSINLGFKHKLSALQLRITNQTGEELTVKEIRLSVAGGKIARSRFYDIATGDWLTIGETKEDYLQLTAKNFPALATGGASQDLHMLFFPGYANTDMIITVITDRGEYTLTKDAPTSPGFEAGKNYLTDITIKTNPSTGSGETWTEYITSKAELIAFRDKVNNGTNYAGKTVRLTADIDLTNETWTTPIGTNALKPFCGTFDGGGHLISKLSVDNGSNGTIGLFGYISGGTVRNLRVSGTVKTTGNYAGGIAGILSGNSTVENCIFDGEVSGIGNVGGIAGWSKETSRIAGCHTKGKVTATRHYAGGIAGLNNNSTIDGCYSQAEVTAGNQNVGGIAGENYNSGTVTHCYATGKVSGESYVGGIVGNQYNGSTVTGCIALNPGLTRTEGTDPRFGRVVGNNNGGTITGCGAFKDMTLPNGVTATSAADGIHGTALPAADCLTPAAYTSRDFPEATATTAGWAFDSKTTWTYLPWNPAFASFSGISEANYKISASHLTGGGTN